MSNIQLASIKPFRDNPKIVPKTKFGPMSKRFNHQEFWYGSIETVGGMTKIAYIPSDSPAVEIIKEGMHNFGHADNQIPDLEKLIDEWECNESDYSRRDVLYTINKDGWRCPNFNKDSDAIMFLGDSFTFGIGVADEDVWCEKVATKQGKTCWNLGNPGGGNQEMILLLESFLESGYIPSEVVVMWKETHRKLIFNGTTLKKNKNHSPQFVINGQSTNADPLLDFMVDHQDTFDKIGMKLEKEINVFTPVWDIANGDPTNPAVQQMKAWTMMHDEHQWFDFYMNRISLQNMCKAHNIKLTELHMLNETAIFCHNIDGNNLLSPNSYPKNFVNPGFEDNDKGRDDAHWGPKYHNHAYKTCISVL